MITLLFAMGTTRLIIMCAVICTALVTETLSATTPSPSELYRRYLASVGGGREQSSEKIKPVPRSTFEEALKAGKTDESFLNFSGMLRTRKPQQTRVSNRNKFYSHKYLNF